MDLRRSLSSLLALKYYTRLIAMNDGGMLIPNEHCCLRRGLKKYPSIDKKLWDASSRWILQWDNIVKHPGARARGCHCDIHKPPWLYPDLGIHELILPYKN